jgi:hypothetical protein
MQGGVVSLGRAGTGGQRESMVWHWMADAILSNNHGGPLKPQT